QDDMDTAFYDERIKERLDIADLTADCPRKVAQRFKLCLTPRPSGSAPLLTPEESANEVLPLIHGPRNGDVEEADHHFVVCLVAPCDSRVRVGIVSILTRIVVPGNRLNFG